MVTAGRMKRASVHVQCQKNTLTSKCLVASSLRDISISLVRMLRKCMSLRRVARFTVVSFVDCGESRAGIQFRFMGSSRGHVCETDQLDESMYLTHLGQT